MGELHQLLAELLAAEPGVAPPPDVALWVGSSVLSALAGALVARVFKKDDRVEQERRAAEAEWRAEIKGDMKRLLDGQAALSSTQALQAKDIATVVARVDHVERRQDEQAKAHRDQVSSLRSEFDARISAVAKRSE